MKAKAIPPAVTVGFLAAEGVTYFAFLTLDLTGRGGDTIPIKYFGVLLCLGFALLACVRWGGDWLVPPALALTAGADWFLLVRNDHYAVGIILFLCVQTVYFLRLRRAGAPAAYPLRAWTRRGRQRRIFAAGLTLFAGCDLCVGLFNVLPPSAPLYPVSSVGMWFFYLPSQVLIALSALPEKEETP